MGMQLANMNNSTFTFKKGVSLLIVTAQKALINVMRTHGLKLMAEYQHNDPATARAFPFVDAYDESVDPPTEFLLEDQAVHPEDYALDYLFERIENAFTKEQGARTTHSGLVIFKHLEDRRAVKMRVEATLDYTANPCHPRVTTQTQIMDKGMGLLSTNSDLARSGHYGGCEAMLAAYDLNVILGLPSDQPRTMVYAKKKAVDGTYWLMVGLTTPTYSWCPWLDPTNRVVFSGIASPNQDNRDVQVWATHLGISKEALIDLIFYNAPI